MNKEFFILILLNWFNLRIQNYENSFLIYMYWKMFTEIRIIFWIAETQIFISIENEIWLNVLF